MTTDKINFLKGLFVGIVLGIAFMLGYRSK